MASIGTAEAEKFERDGYLVVENVIEEQLLEDIRKEAHILADTMAEQDAFQIWHERALFRRKPFREVLKVSRLVDTARKLIGDDVQLLAMDLLCTRPGNGSVAWHRDVAFHCNKTLSINTGIYLYDMTVANGPLRVVPGSHRTEQQPAAKGVTEEKEMMVPIKGGSAVFFDAGLLHSGSPNMSDDRRLALFPYFGHYFIKRMDSFFTQALPAELTQSEDPFVRQLLGLGLMEGSASYHGDSEAYNQRGEAGIDFVAA